jgi:hypothetical protein
MVQIVTRKKVSGHWIGRADFHSSAARSFRLFHHVPLELADARDLPPTLDWILESGGHPDPRANPFQGRPRGKNGKVALEEGEYPGEDGRTDAGPEGGVARRKRIRRESTKKYSYGKGVLYEYFEIQIVKISGADIP